MRIRVPRSSSPSPERVSTPTNRFRVPLSSDSDSSDSDEISSDEEVASHDRNISADASTRDGDEEDDEDLVGRWNNLRVGGRSSGKERVVSDAVISIRNHARHVDPYEEWESRMRKDAFVTARRRQALLHQKLREGRERNIAAIQDQRAQLQRFQEERNREDLAKRRSALSTRERISRIEWEERSKRLRQGVEAAIQQEEAKFRAAQEAERKRKEEEERKRRELEEKRKKEEEEKKRIEEEERKRDAEETLKKEMMEAEKREKEAKANAEQSQQLSLLELREMTGMFECEDMWRIGIRCLKYLKDVTMRAVKGPRPPSPEPAGYQAPPPPPLKKLWNAQRRQITPKIGQLTDDEREIARITGELKAIVAPIPNMPRADDAQNLHHALLASFAKAVIAQAETEITAHKTQANPLARVAASLIVTYPPLGDIFFARLCARVGSWAAGTDPIPVDDESWDKLSDKDKQKRSGMRPDENPEEQMMRIGGVMRLYFAMLFIHVKEQVPVKDPMPAPFRPCRLWLYIAHLLNNARLLEKPVAPEIIYVALDEGGLLAKAIWGKQFVKMLQFIYEGISGEQKIRFGGPEVLAQAARARCQLEIEKIIAHP